MYFNTHAGKTEPSTAPLILMPGTELHIVPSTLGTNESLEINETNNDMQNTSFLSSIFNTIKRGVGYENHANQENIRNSNFPPPSKPKLKPPQRDFEKIFRVTSTTDLYDYPNDISSVIYINDIDIPISFRAELENYIFVATIKKVLSPYEKSESSSKKPLGLTTSNSKAAANTDEDPHANISIKSNKTEWDFQTAIVKARLVNHGMLNQGDLIPGYAALNDDLRRQLGLEITSSIVVKCLDYQHSCLTVLKIHPLTVLVRYDIFQRGQTLVNYLFISNSGVSIPLPFS